MADSYFLYEYYTNSNILFHKGKIVNAIRTIIALFSEEYCFNKFYNYFDWKFQSTYNNYQKAKNCSILYAAYIPEYTTLHHNLTLSLSLSANNIQLDLLLNKALNLLNGLGLNKT